MKVIKLNKNNQRAIIDQACQVIKAGGLLIYPTETVYGAGVDATNQAAVNKLLVYKSRREGKPMSIAVTDIKMAAQYVEINQQAKNIYDKFLPGPITIVSKITANNNQLAAGVASEFNTLGIRIPDYQLILNLVKALGKPITSTSANASGKKRPYSIKDILDNLSKRQQSLIDLIIDAGQLPKNPPSTVIDTTHSTPVTSRKGKISEFSNHQQGKEKKAQKKNQATSKKNPKQNIPLIIDSQSETETQAIAGKLMLKNWEKIKKHGLIIGLDGKLGAGKTIFAKGAANFLKIEEVLTSPTYSYLNEYDYQRHQISGKLYHLDMWKIDNQAEFKLLKFDKLVKAKNIIIIEWFEQIKSYLDKKIIDQTLLVTIEDVDDNQRKLTINEQ